MARSLVYSNSADKSSIIDIALYHVLQYEIFMGECNDDSLTVLVLWSVKYSFM